MRKWLPITRRGFCRALGSREKGKKETLSSRKRKWMSEGGKKGNFLHAENGLKAMPLKGKGVPPNGSGGGGVA